MEKGGIHLSPSISQLLLISCTSWDMRHTVPALFVYINTRLIDHLSNTKLQPSMPKLPLNMGHAPHSTSLRSAISGQLMSRNMLPLWQRMAFMWSSMTRFFLL